MASTKNLSNLVSSENPVNEFITILDDTYEILSEYDETESVFVALSDFTIYATSGDLSLFWVNYVSPQQAKEFRRSLPVETFSPNTLIFTTPTILIGWKRMCDSSIQYYWLRIVDGDMYVVVTKNIGDIVQTIDLYGNEGLCITKESDLDISRTDDPICIMISDNNYYSIMKGLSGVIGNYIKNNIDVQFLDGINTIGKQVTPSKSIRIHEPTLPHGSHDHIEVYPICNSNLDVNMFSISVAMIHDYVKHIRNRTNKTMYVYTTDSDTRSRFCIGRQVISSGNMLYFISNYKGTISVDVYMDVVTATSNDTYTPVAVYTVSDNQLASDTIIVPTTVLADILATTSKVVEG